MTVRIPSGAKPSLVAGDETRPELRVAAIEQNGDGWVLSATDSYRAIRLKVLVDGDEQPHVVPAEAIERAEAAGYPDDGWTVNEDGQVEPLRDVVLFKKPELHKTRDDGLPVWLDRIHPPKQPRKRDQFTVGINARMLAELAEALGAIGGEVYLTFDLSEADRRGGKDGHRVYEKAIRVEGGHGTALQMPLKGRDH